MGYVPGGLLRYKCDGWGGGGGGGGPTYFFGSKIFNSCIFLGWRFNRVFFWVWQICTYFFMYFFGSKMSSLVFFGVHNIRSMYIFGCKILGSVGPPPHHVYTRVTHLGVTYSKNMDWLVQCWVGWNTGLVKHDRARLLQSIHVTRDYYFREWNKHAFEFLCKAQHLNGM